LGKPAFHSQWNLALYRDSSLILVPGSHRRARSQTEREAGPYDELPGEIRVVLEPGEMAFYNNNILHRGAYDCTVERLTLHGSMGHVEGGGLRARNVLQHGRGWIGGVDLGGLEEGVERERARGMRDRLVQLGSKFGETGFSQDD
jgi:nicotinamide N-methyltransferase